MAFVRKRTTKTGACSAALVETYRNPDGKPRQRVLANLHGAETVLDALAKLAAQREVLRAERAQLESEVTDDGELLVLGAPSKFWQHHVASCCTNRLQSVLQRRVQVEVFDKSVIAAVSRDCKRAKNAAAALEQPP